MASVPQTSNGSRCRGTNREGEPCQRHASEPGGLCIVHAGKQSMSELGRRGGRVKPTTKLRANVDDELREQAREVVAKALRGEEVPKAALDSARSLFSYRADQPPAGQQEREQPAGRGVFGMADLVEAAGELRIFSQLGGISEDAERELVERLKARQGRDQDDAHTPAGATPRKESARPRVSGSRKTPRDGRSAIAGPPQSRNLPKPCDPLVATAAR
jgi:hypothetical protein